jgi:hypothetical protein
MAQQQGGGFAEVLQFALFAGVALVAWNLYTAYQLGQAQASTTPSTPTSTPTTTATTSVPAIVIPANFSVVIDVNNSLRGTVTYNGTPTSFNVIPANAGASTGVVYNTSGQDVTALLGPANVTTLVNAFNAAAASEKVSGTLSGFSGFGQVARIAVPRMLRRR